MFMSKTAETNNKVTVIYLDKIHQLAIIINLKKKKKSSTLKFINKLSYSLTMIRKVAATKI